MYREARSYYNVAGVEAEEIIDGMNMLHREGAAIKYLFRCNKLNPKGEFISDLRKCKHYLGRCLQFTEPQIRDFTASYWISKINPEVFNHNIYNSILEIIMAIGEPGANYKENIKNCIDYIDNAIEQY